MNTPAPRYDLSPIDRARLQPSTRTKYKSALFALYAAAVNPLNATELQTYAATLAPSLKTQLKAALKIMYADTVQRLKASATPQNIGTVQAALLRLEAMDKTLFTHQPETKRLPHWLTQAQVDQMTAIALEMSLRDYIVIALLLGCGLRREELSTLTHDHLKHIDGQTVLYVRGKGDKVRLVPVPPVLVKRLSEWHAETGPGRIVRSIHKTGKIGRQLSAVGIFAIVRKYGKLIGIADLDPHDCRRTYGRLVYEQTQNILLVKDLLGHSNVKTTQKYIGLQHHTTAPEIIRDTFAMQITGD